MKALLVLMSLVSLSFVAQANLGDRVTVQQPVCYGREYSQDHMSAHPKQSVQQLRLKFYRSEMGDGLLMDIQAKILRKTASGKVLKNFKSGMSCVENGSGLNCFIECDGGSAKVRWDAKSVDKEIIFENRGFILEGGCGEEGETIYLESHKDGDDIFKLYTIPASYCQR